VKTVDRKKRRPTRATNYRLLQPAEEPKTARGRATRRKILRAAEQCFAECGYSQASVAEIVRRGGVAQGTFYQYFDSKEEIFVELIRALYQEMAGSTRRGAELARGQGRLAVEVEATKSYFQWLADHRELHRILNLMDEVDRNLSVEYYVSFARSYADSLAEAMEQHEIQRVDPDLLASVLMGANAHVSMRYNLWDDEDGGEMTDELWEDFAKIIGGALRGATAGA